MTSPKITDPRFRERMKLITILIVWLALGILAIQAKEKPGSCLATATVKCHDGRVRTTTSQTLVDVCPGIQASVGVSNGRKL